MRVKTFRAKTNTQVLAMVKAELGEDAIILSNKTVDNGEGKVCEIMAAVEQSSKIPEPLEKAADTSAASTASAMDDYMPPSSGKEPGWAEEWGQIKGHLLALLKPQMNLESLSPRQRLALEYLEREGVDTKVLLSVYRALASGGEESVLPVLKTFTPVKPFEPARLGAKFHMFTGPSGSGKTSTLIRLALADKRENPKARICLACADSGQGKGRLVLKHYAELSGLAFREIAVAEDFDALMADSHAFDRVYVDSPSLGPGESLAEVMDGLGMGGHQDMAVHLVMAAHFAPAQYERFFKVYRCSRLASLIWTKLDEACAFGAIVNGSHASGLPVSALSFGRGLRGSIAPARDKDLWRVIFKHQMPGKA